MLVLVSPFDLGAVPVASSVPVEGCCLSSLLVMSGLAFEESALLISSPTRLAASGAVAAVAAARGFTGFLSDGEDREVSFPAPSVASLSFKFLPLRGFCDLERLVRKTALTKSYLSRGRIVPDD